jgi:hypothetical protein
MAQNSITIRRLSVGGWQVIIIENEEQTVREFENGGFALSYAEGQGMRLCVPVTHVREAELTENGEPPSMAACNPPVAMPSTSSLR